MKKLLILALLAIGVYLASRTSIASAGEAEGTTSESYNSTSATVDVPPDPLLPAPKDGLSEKILKRTAYTVSYNCETRQPNWVAWTITRECVSEENMIVDRPRNAPFHEDDDVPTPRATLDDYRGSGWTRGHLCPAGDCRWRSDVQYESFLLSNICPQARALNAGIWNDIEKDCRRWAIKYGKVYVVSGPIFFKKSDKGTIGRSHVKVPDAFFKAILCLDSKTPMGIGFVCRNEDVKSPEAGTTPSGRKRKKAELYIHSIDEVERITGYDLFASLPDDIETAVESHADIEDWRKN